MRVRTIKGKDVKRYHIFNNQDKHVLSYRIIIEKKSDWTKASRRVLAKGKPYYLVTITWWRSVGTIMARAVKHHHFYKHRKKRKANDRMKGLEKKIKAHHTRYTSPMKIPKK